MKQWEMPKVQAEQFISNDFISTCSQITPIISDKNHHYWYIDINKDEKYNLLPSSAAELLGKDGNYSMSASATYYTKFTWATLINPDHDLSCWLDNVDVYYQDGSANPEDGESYTGGTGRFNYFGTFDVYASRNKAVALYPNTTDPSFDPTSSFNRS